MPLVKNGLAILLLFLLILFLVLRYQKKPIFSESFSLLGDNTCRCGCLQRGRLMAGCRCRLCPFRALSSCPCGCAQRGRFLSECDQCPFRRMLAGSACPCGCGEMGRKLKKCACADCPFMVPAPQENFANPTIEGFNENEPTREELPLGVDASLAEAAGIKPPSAYQDYLLGRLCRAPCRIRQPNCSGDPYSQSDDDPNWRGMRYYLPQETVSGQDENLWVPTESGYKL